MFFSHGFKVPPIFQLSDSRPTLQFHCYGGPEAQTAVGLLQLNIPGGGGGGGGGGGNKQKTSLGALSQ